MKMHKDGKGRDRRHKYPWDKWADGQEHLIDPDDHNTTAYNLKMAAYSYARTNGYVPYVSKTSMGEVIVQFYRTQEERNRRPNRYTQGNQHTPALEIPANQVQSRNCETCDDPLKGYALNQGLSECTNPEATTVPIARALLKEGKLYKHR